MTKETTTGWEEEIPHLKIERMADNCLLLTCPDSTGNGDDLVTVHPTQLRFMAEKLGLVREMSASDADTIGTLRRQNADAVKVVQTMVRRMRALEKRIDHIGMWLCTHSDAEHADLTYEQDYATATAEICEEFCSDLDDMLERVSEVTLAALPATAPATPATSRESSGTASVKAPENGTLRTGPKTGVFEDTQERDSSAPLFPEEGGVAP